MLHRNVNCAKHLCDLCSVFSIAQYNLPSLWASIGRTRSYSIRLFLCALDHCIPVGHGLYTQFTRPFPCFVKVLCLACEIGDTIQARASTFFIGFRMPFCVSTFFPLDVTWHHYTSRAFPCRSYTTVLAIKYWRQWGFGNEAKFRGIMDQYVILLQSNYQALIFSEIKLSSSWWENLGTIFSV